MPFLKSRMQLKPQGMGNTGENAATKNTFSFTYSILKLLIVSYWFLLSSAVYMIAIHVSPVSTGTANVKQRLCKSLLLSANFRQLETLCQLQQPTCGTWEKIPESQMGGNWGDFIRDSEIKGNQISPCLRTHEEKCRFLNIGQRC